MMKKILVLQMFLVTSLVAFGDDSIDLRIAELENKVKVLETTINSKLSNCELKYQYLGPRLNKCDAGTFVRSVTKINDSSMQLECGYYQIQCTIK